MVQSLAVFIVLPFFRRPRCLFQNTKPWQATLVMPSWSNWLEGLKKRVDAF